MSVCTRRLCTPLDVRKASAGAELDIDFNEASPRVRLDGDLWAVASLRPHRIDFIHADTGERVWSAPLQGLDFDLPSSARLFLGATACSTTPVGDESPLVKTPCGPLVFASSRGVAVVNPKTRSRRVLLFPTRCPGDSP